MQIKELKKQLELNPHIQVCVINHTASSFFLVQIRNEEKVELLTGWRGQQRVFRSLDEATEELKRHGIHRALLLKHVDHDGLMGRESFYQGLNPVGLSLSF